MSEHRGHYLQERNPAIPENYSTRPMRPRVLYLTTCDCGWVGNYAEIGRESALQYANHVNAPHAEQAERIAKLESENYRLKLQLDRTFRRIDSLKEDR